MTLWSPNQASGVLTLARARTRIRFRFGVRVKVRLRVEVSAIEQGRPAQPLSGI